MDRLAKHHAERTDGSAGHEIQLVLCEGFRGQTVTIAVDGREIYRQAAVTTDARTLVADTIRVTIQSRRPDIVVSIMPGALTASFTLDVSAHRRVAIRVIGEGTVNVETYPT